MALVRAYFVSSAVLSSSMVMAQLFRRKIFVQIFNNHPFQIFIPFQLLHIPFVVLPLEKTLLIRPLIPAYFVADARVRSAEYFPYIPYPYALMQHFFYTSPLFI